MPPAVLFDIDGTLVTFEFDVQGTRGAILELLRERGFDVTGLSLSSPTQQMMDAARGQVDRGVVKLHYPRIRREIYSILDAFEVKSAKQATIFEGTIGTLDALRRRSTRLGVVTNSGRPAADSVLGRYGLLEYFEFVLTRDDVEEMKPGSAGLAKALSLLSLPPSQVVYVGDSLLDIRASKGAGVRSVSVATGNYTEERLRAEGAEEVISSISLLPELLAC